VLLALGGGPRQRADAVDDAAATPDNAACVSRSAAYFDAQTPALALRRDIQTFRLGDEVLDDKGDKL
jgi:hypothetical protein